ncbi:polysaccharide biosynthesis C-terminal domain-containing protein, partial [bacterium]|nr:polysaccharide biosynthesis C-terminal domain-containing protein [bacterium]
PISAQVLAVLGLNLNFALLNTLMILIFTARNRQRWLVGFTGLAVAFSFGANWLLIPLWHQVGAAYATLFSQAVLFVIMGCAGLRLFGLGLPIKRLAQIALITLTSTAAAYIIPGVPALAVPFIFGGLLIAQAKLFHVISFEEIRRLAQAD